MPDLEFAVESADIEPYAAAPLLLLRLRISDRDAPPLPVHGVILQCQVRIDPAQRRYSPAEQERLREMFGLPEQWRHSLRTLLWMHTQASAPAFTGTTVIDLPLPCSFDLSIAATKYFDGLQEGQVPLLLLFSGTVFYAAPHAPLQAAPIAWDREARISLPLEVWRDLMERYYPNSAWLCLPRDVVDRIHQYQVRAALPTWEQALERLLEMEAAEAGVPA